MCSEHFFPFLCITFIVFSCPKDSLAHMHLATRIQDAFTSSSIAHAAVSLQASLTSCKITDPSLQVIQDPSFALTTEWLLFIQEQQILCCESFSTLKNIMDISIFPPGPPHFSWNLHRQGSRHWLTFRSGCKPYSLSRHGAPGHDSSKRSFWLAKLHKRRYSRTGSQMLFGMVDKVAVLQHWLLFSFPLIHILLHP